MFIYKQPCKAHICLNKNIQYILFLKANRFLVLKYILIQVCLVLDTERRPRFVDVQSTHIFKKERKKHWCKQLNIFYMVKYHLNEDNLCRK